MLPVAASTALKNWTEGNNGISGSLQSLHYAGSGKTLLFRKEESFDLLSGNGSFDKDNFAVFPRNAIPSESDINDVEDLKFLGRSRGWIFLALAISL